MGCAPESADHHPAAVVAEGNVLHLEKWMRKRQKSGGTVNSHVRNKQSTPVYLKVCPCLIAVDLIVVRREVNQSHPQAKLVLLNTWWGVEPAAFGEGRVFNVVECHRVYLLKQPFP